METSRQSSDDPLASRVVELEMLYTHLQRLFGDLDEVVRGQQKQIQSLGDKIAALGADLNAVSSHVPDQRKPEDEKPPHY